MADTVTLDDLQQLADRMWQELPEKAEGGVRFSQKEIDGIMAGNAQAAFGY